MMEIKPESEYVTHHIQKVCSLFAAMRCFATTLETAGHQVRYFNIGDEDNAHDFTRNLQAVASFFQANIIRYQLPDEYRLDTYFKTSKLNLTPVDSEHFLSNRSDLATFFHGKKTFLMESFYRHMRKKFDVLMDGNQPVGGQWNFDHDNRKKLPATMNIEVPILIGNDLRSINDEVRRAGIKTIGNIEPEKVPWTIDRSSALSLLNQFIAVGLQHFGTYQDAMVTSHWYLYHARLSFALNIKLISPLEVIRAVEQAYQEFPTKYALNQVEGFIRQLLGWREYMRGIYWAKMPAFAELNYLNHKAPLPRWFWTGETQMNCLHHAIGQSLNHAYAHHIQRLMVTGNFALLAGVHPDELDQWYLGIYIDAFEWVEITNTRGMSQFADGGIVGTKPYVSSAAYIQKMSNYCEGCHYNYKDKLGEKACPFNALYWDFYDRNRSLLSNNPRIGMMYKVWDKMEANQKTALLQKADEIKKNMDFL
jgi:deoxyribodipyrimidine photolyase-related protein